MGVTCLCDNNTVLKITLWCINKTNLTKYNYCLWQLFDCFVFWLPFFRQLRYKNRAALILSCVEIKCKKYGGSVQFIDTDVSSVSCMVELRPLLFV